MNQTVHENFLYGRPPMALLLAMIAPMTQLAFLAMHLTDTTMY